MEDLVRLTNIGGGVPRVCRLGLATRDTGSLTPADVLWAVNRGVNYLNWCGAPDGLSRAVASLKARRHEVALAVQLSARSADRAQQELEGILRQLGTDYVDVVTLYYVERRAEWQRICGAGGALEMLRRAQRGGQVRLIGLTSHQRRLAAEVARSGGVDLLMIRYNAAHRGAEEEVFPHLPSGFPVVVYTCLRWGALIRGTPADPPETPPPVPVDCYRFALSHPTVSVALMAPGDRRELNENMTILDDWRAMRTDEEAALRAHGDRVHRTAGRFP